METEFEDCETHYAYSCIHEFFAAFHVSHAIAFIHSIIYSACSKKVWNREIPANLLCFMDNLRPLCKAMYVVNNTATRRNAAIIAPPGNGPPDLNITDNFQDNYFRSCPWNNLPRSLTEKQYHNPYKAINKFCRHKTEKEWNQFFKHLEAYSLSHDELDEEYRAHEILKSRKRLLQVIEACHLIEVRTNKRKKEDTKE